jgi:hypothetical protein
VEIVAGLALIVIGIVVAAYAWTRRAERDAVDPPSAVGTGDVEADIAETAYSVMQRWPRAFHWGGLALGVALAAAGVVVLAT